MVLFLEHIPYVLETWLRENPNKLQKVLDDLRMTIAFLRTKGIIHFDAHFRNVLTDGEQIYLTDFGLALDRSFALTKEELFFFEQNTFYDYGEVLRNLGHLIRASYNSCSENDKRRMMEKYGMEGGHVHGHEAVRDYWTRQWKLINPIVEPTGFQPDENGRIVVTVYQVVRDLEGNLMVDQMVQHVYTFANGLIQRMDIQEP